MPIASCRIKTRERNIEVIRLYTQELQDTAPIAKSLGITPSMVGKILRSANIPNREKRGEHGHYLRRHTPSKKGYHQADDKIATYRKTGVLHCEKHGTHSNFRILERLHRYWCRLCEQEQHEEKMRTQKLSLILSWAKNRKKWGCDLTEEDLVETLVNQKLRCALTGILFDSTLSNISLDRIDSSKGYTKGNIQFVLTQVNKMKSNFPQQEFTRLCGLVWNNTNIKTPSEV